MYTRNQVLYTLLLANNKHVYWKRGLIHTICVNNKHVYKKPDDMPTAMVNNSVYSICFHVLKADFR